MCKEDSRTSEKRVLATFPEIIFIAVAFQWQLVGSGVKCTILFGTTQLTLHDFATEEDIEGRGSKVGPLQLRLV